MPSHRINLRGPWDYCWLESSSKNSEPTSESGTVAMPKEWQAVFGEASGRARFRRKFHRPTNLEPHEGVFIVLTEVRGAGCVRLNDVSVGTFESEGDSAEFDISSSMKSFNELDVEIEFDPTKQENTSGGLFGLVALEIRS